MLSGALPSHARGAQYVLRLQVRRTSHTWRSRHRTVACQTQRRSNSVVERFPVLPLWSLSLLFLPLLTAVLLLAIVFYFTHPSLYFT
jgi:hypothetical protein